MSTLSRAAVKRSSKKIAVFFWGGVQQRGLVVGGRVGVWVDGLGPLFLQLI